jgi:hypothetical protein
MLSNGNHFKVLKSLTGEYEIPVKRANQILLRAEQEGSCQVHDKKITVSYNNKFGYTLHAEEEEG